MRKGEHWSQEQRQRFSEIALRNGVGHWMKGRPKSEAHKRAIGAAHLGKPKLGNRGDGNVNWKGGVSWQKKTARNVLMQTLEYKNWRRNVFQRDDFTCQACGQRGGDLEADHELPFATFPELTFEVLNGRTLCVECHHKTFVINKRVYAINK